MQIKKLVDDASPSVDLRLISTVADIFVNRGKAEADGHDQRGTVRVIPKPSTEIPERFPSVVQDWDGAIRDAHRRKSTKKVTRFSPIREDDELLNGWKSSPVPHEFDITGGPDNRDPPATSCVAIADTPPVPDGGSEELGDSPSPATREPTPHPPFGSHLFRRASAELINGSNEHVSASATGSGILTITGISNSHKRKRHSEQNPPGHRSQRGSHSSERMSPTSPSVLHKPKPTPAINENSSRKRKQSPEPDRPAKQPRTEANVFSQKSPTPTHTSPPRRRVSVFSSPRRRVSISDESRHTPEHGLGLGITRSPQHSKKRTDDLASSQRPIKGPSFQSNARIDSSQNSEKPHLPSSALKKEPSTARGRSQERRSVSFADSKDGHHDDTTNTSLAPQKSQAAPPSSQMSEMVWPPGFSQEQIEQFQRQAEKIAGARRDSSQGKSNAAKKPPAQPRPAVETYKKSNHAKSKPTRHGLLEEITGIEKRLRDSRISKTIRVGLKERLKNAHQELQEEAAKSLKSEPQLPALGTTVARQIPENEDRAMSQTSNRSLHIGTNALERSASSTSHRQTASLSAREKSKSPYQVRKEPVETARTVTPVSSSLHRSRSRSDSVSNLSKSNDTQGKQATSMSPSVKEEDDFDTENSLNSARYSESAMDVDNVEEQEEGGEDASSTSHSSSDSSGSEVDDGDDDDDDDTDQDDSQDDDQDQGDDEVGGQDDTSELKVQNSRDQKEGHSPTPEQNMHLNVSETPSESEDGQENEPEIYGNAQEHVVNGDQNQVNVQGPGSIDVSGDSDDSNGLEHGENPGDNIAEEVKDLPMNGDQENPNARIPEDVNEAVVLSDSGEPEYVQNAREGVSTVQTHTDHGHPGQVNGQVNGQVPVLGDSTGFQSQAGSQTQANNQAPTKPGESSDDSSEDSDSDSDESDSLPLPKQISVKSKTPVGSSNSVPAKPQPPASKGLPVLQRTTLKGLLKAQKEESQRREQQHQETQPQRPSGTNRDVYEVPSSRESKSSSDDESEGGDIPHGGFLSRLRRPWGGRR